MTADVNPSDPPLPDRVALRVLDANANRAREALRVVEDYCRLGLDDRGLSEELKRIRHDVAAALRGVVAEAILHRDTPGDVGTSVKTVAEQSRAGLAAVVTAAGKRAGEALRVVEEVLKTTDPRAAAQVEAARYRFYDVEHRVALTLRPPASRFATVRLYVLITESACTLPWLRAAEEAIRGGADCLQLREKSLGGGELLRRAKELVAVCRKHGVVSIINDRPDVALLSGADGVHVGQDDLPCREVRRLVGDRLLVGVSTHSIEHARQAVLDGADYVGVGPVFRSRTKPREILPGLDYARAVARDVPIPAVAIAGIDEGNVDEVIKTGVRAVAVTAAVVGAADPRAAAARLKEKLDDARAPTPSVGAPSPSVGQAFLPASASVHRRRLPHWRADGAVYFVTFRVATGQLSMSERLAVLQHVRTGDGRYYRLDAAVVMPDHGHVVLEPLDGFDLSRITKGIKGVSARIVNTMRGTGGPLWQDESFDRIVRDLDEYVEKLTYVWNNPVKAGLVDEPDQYPAAYVNQAFS